MHTLAENVFTIYQFCDILFVLVISKSQGCPAECDVPVQGIAGTVICLFFLVVSEQISTRKSLRIGIGRILSREKVLEPVSEKFGTGKSPGTGQNFYTHIS